MAAHFEVRQMQLGAARKLLGRAIGQCPKAKLFRAYIELELQLGTIERVRTLYQKFLEWAPANCAAWCKFADLERSLGELDRARSIFELAIAQPVLDMPEVLWKVRSSLDLMSIWASFWRGALVSANNRPDECSRHALLHTSSQVCCGEGPDEGCWTVGRTLDGRPIVAGP